MSLPLLFTVLSLLASVVATLMAYVARESAANAKHSEHRLSIMRGQVAGLEAALMGLDAKFQKLAGRVYADQYWRGKRDEQPDLNLNAPTGPDGSSRDICENWAKAQQEGPGSIPAMCMCAYCESMRESRAARRRATLPRGVKS